MTGFLVLVLAAGEQIDTPVPKGKQLDWEGILTPNPKDFIAKTLPWISTRSQTDIPSAWLKGEAGYRLEEIFDTTRKMLAGIIGE